MAIIPGNTTRPTRSYEKRSTRLPPVYFSPGNPGLFRPIVDELIQRDEYLLLADYPSYIECQERISQTYQDRDTWTRMSILNVARIGKFSSDRAIREYCQDIWHSKPVPIELDAAEEPEEVGLRLVQNLP